MCYIIVSDQILRYSIILLPNLNNYEDDCRIQEDKMHWAGVFKRRLPGLGMTTHAPGAVVVELQDGGLLLMGAKPMGVAPPGASA